jgi:hypothetical protein
MKIVRWFAGSPVSRIYLALVAVAIAFAQWEHQAWVERDAVVSGTYPMFATAPAHLLTLPTSWLLEYWLVGWSNGLWSWTWPVLVGALVNIAAVKGMRALVHRRRRPAGPPAAGLPGHDAEPHRPDAR